MSEQKPFPFRFFIITFLWSWVIWLPLTIQGRGLLPSYENLISKISFPLMLLGAFGPAVGAYLSVRTLEGKKAAILFLKSFFSLRFGWKIWVSVFLLLGLSTALAWFVPELWGAERLGMLLPNIYIFPVYWLIMVFFGGGQEEIGWRGYIMPYMENRFGYVIGTIILGLIWACWHLPLWFILETNQTYMNFGGFCMLTVGYSFIFSWVVRASGNRPFSALIVHGTANAFISVFPVIIMEDGAPQIRFWLWVSLTLLIGLVFMVFSLKKKDTAA